MRKIEDLHWKIVIEIKTIVFVILIEENYSSN